jgi:hypothetical protein
VPSFYSFVELLLYGIQVKRRAILHWREFDRGFSHLDNFLLDVDETPEFAHVEGHYVGAGTVREISVGIALERIAAQVMDRVPFLTSRLVAKC